MANRSRQSRGTAALGAVLRIGKKAKQHPGIVLLVFRLNDQLIAWSAGNQISTVTLLCDVALLNGEIIRVGLANVRREVFVLTGNLTRLCNA